MTVHPLVLFAAGSLIAAPLLAQSPWAKAPAVPTGCYAERDTFGADADAARTELEAAIESQEKINKAQLGQIHDMEPAQLQQRLMAAVQKNPAKATQIMQAMQSLGTADDQKARSDTEKEVAAFNERKAKMVGDFAAERQAAWKPIFTRIQADAERLPKAAADRSAAAGNAEYDGKYQSTICPKWMKAGAPIATLLADFRAHLETEVIPKRREGELAAGGNLELFGLPSKEYRPVAEMQGVVLYLKMATDLLAAREGAPRAQ